MPLTEQPKNPLFFFGVGDFRRLTRRIADSYSVVKFPNAPRLVSPMQHRLTRGCRRRHSTFSPDWAEWKYTRLPSRTMVTGTG